MPTKAKTPARTQGFFQFQMVARGGIDQGRRMSILIETFDETALLG
jgi:hypothetical protein